VPSPPLDDHADRLVGVRGFAEPTSVRGPLTDEWICEQHPDKPAAFCGRLAVDWHFCEPADPEATGGAGVPARAARPARCWPSASRRASRRLLRVVFAPNAVL
jgi:hypothetical protein